MASTNTPINSQDWIDRINDSDDYIKDMMSFYNNGWSDRGEDDERKVKDRIKANILLTFTYIDEILSDLSKIEVSAKCVYLKVNSFTKLSVIISVPLEKYLSDNFVKIYATSSKIEKTSRSENYSVRFTFTFDDGDLNEENLRSDGYHKTHSKIEN